MSDLLFPTEADMVIPFAGSAYDESRDRQRLETQLEHLLWLVKDGNWRTVQRIRTELLRSFPGGHFPENSLQAQLRNLRKIGFTVDRRHVTGVAGLFEYRVAPTVSEQSLGAKLLAKLGVRR